MEQVITKESIIKSESKSDDLINQFIELDFISDNYPSLQLWLLLNEKPEVNTVSIIKMIEKGMIDLNVKIIDPFVLIQEKKASNVFVKQIEIQLFDKKNNITITSVKGYGSESTYRLQSVLYFDQCISIYDALKNSPSYIHIKAIVTFQIRNDETTVKLLIPFRSILNTHFFSLSEKIKNSIIKIRYFDPAKVNYVDAPVFSIKRTVSGDRSARLPAKMIKVNTGFVQPASLIKPEKTIAFSPVSQPEAIMHKNKLWYLDDIRIKEASTKNPSLPLITDQEVVLWNDSVGGNKFWYMPEYIVEVPQQNVSSASSPFLLTFKKIGSDLNGQPVLQGQLRITLTPHIPESAKKIQNDPGSTLFPIVFSSQTFVLEIPFLDADGTSKTSALTPSETTITNNQVHLEFNLTNIWVRACYGVLSIEGFQSVRSNVIMYSSFFGMVKAQKGELKVLASATLLKLPLIKTNSILNAPVFNVISRTLEIDQQSVKFPDTQNGRAPGLAQAKMKNNLAIPANIASANIVMGKPGQDLPQKVESGDQLIERSFAKEHRIEVFFPCNVFGQSYVEEDVNGTLQTIGCREPYRLGEIKFHLYDEITELRTPRFKIYRSLQSPDHFLTVPTKYRITRFQSNNTESAFKPCMHLYGAIDETNNFQNSLCLLDMSLDPDIPVFDFYELKKNLEKYCNGKPVIEFPGEIMKEVKFNWSLPAGTQINTISIGRSIQLTVSLDIMEVLTLQTMIKKGSLNGIAIYVLQDKTEFSVSLNPDTSNITGPWDTGPLDIVKAADKVTFFNKTEKSIQLYKIIQVDQGNRDEVIHTINKVLAPGDQHIIENTVTDSNYIPDCFPEPKETDLDQNWVYVDDVTLQVIFTTDINFEENKINAIDIQLNFIDGPPGTKSGSLLPTEPVKDFESLIPLTKISGKKTISYRIRKVNATSTSEFSEWIQWDIKDNGNIINVTSNQLFIHK
jgi:hypothetical protein